MNYWLLRNMPEKIRIVAVVKFNDREAFVLNRMPELEYSRYGDTIVGTDGTFHECYGKWIDPVDKAFGGREFELRMKDGEVVHCKGQWWSSITAKARKVIGENIIPLTLSTVEELRECYVFSGGIEGTREKIAVLRAEYEGPIYDYDEYRKILKDV